MNIKDKKDCKYDLISLGEVMLRLDPGEGRIRSTRSFTAWEGGGEYNVARGLAKCFRMDTAIVTGLVKNDVGLLIEDFINQGNVATEFIVWRDFDGIGRTVRNGLNFTERGFGVRGALGISDRAYTAASQLKPGDIDWDYIFGEVGARWFHTGGIFAALSETTGEVVIEAVKAAKKYGTMTSYDLNYRPSLWKDIGGQAQCQKVNREIAKYIDVMIGNEEDFTACLGFEVEGNTEDLTDIDTDAYNRMIREVAKEYPNFKVIGNTLRDVITASINDWGAQVWHDGKVYMSRHYDRLEILDRVGGGDSFASGLIYGILTGKTMEEAVNYGAAHGALAMTTAGDTSQAKLDEVENLVRGGSARVKR